MAEVFEVETPDGTIFEGPTQEAALAAARNHLKTAFNASEVGQEFAANPESKVAAGRAATGKYTGAEADTVIRETLPENLAAGAAGAALGATVMNPVPALVGLGGSYVGGKLGREAGNLVGAPGLGQAAGSVLGGVAGGLSGASGVKVILNLLSAGGFKAELRRRLLQAAAKQAPAAEAAVAPAAAAAAAPAAEAAPAAASALTAFAKQAAPSTGFGQKIWMLLKDGNPVKVLTPDEARGAQAAGNVVTWVKNTWGS